MKISTRYKKIALLIIILLPLSVKGVNGHAISDHHNNMNTIDDSLKIDTLLVQSIYPEAGVLFYKDKLIVLSSSAYQQRMLPGHVSFGKEGVYLANPMDPDKGPNKMLIHKHLFPIHPSNICIDETRKILYFSKVNPEQDNSRDIYQAAYNETESGQIEIKDSEIERLPFSSKDHSEMHPTISSDGSFLIFASDKNGANEDIDLFIVRYNGTSWQEAHNLGSGINTSGNESYPFLDSENNLFFSSNGHSGFGAYDIYMCKFNGNSWNGPVNLMSPINSTADDIAFKISKNNRLAFYSVNNQAEEATNQLIRIICGDKISKVLLDNAREAYMEIFDDDLSQTIENKIFLPETASANEDAATEINTEADSDPAIPEEALTSNVAQIPDMPEQETEETSISQEESPESLNPQQTPDPVPMQESNTRTEDLSSDQAFNLVQEEPMDELEDSDTEPEKDVVIFRVQITSSTTSKGSNYNVSIGGTSYPTFEYFYVGAYRYTVGDFTDLDKAKAFQKECRAAGFSQAFVAAFINDVRETDPGVFRR